MCSESKKKKEIEYFTMHPKEHCSRNVFFSFASSFCRRVINRTAGGREKKLSAKNECYLGSL
jgi:hypothetical protein